MKRIKLSVSAFVLAAALLVERDQPDEQFLFRRFLIRALVRARRGTAGLADQPVAVQDRLDLRHGFQRTSLLCFAGWRELRDDRESVFRFCGGRGTSRARGRKKMIYIFGKDT